jgi:DNA-binding Xre family transcriptional regulator
MLAEWLNLKNLTQADVIRETGLSPNAVSRMYHNNFDRIDCKTALTLCDYLDCPFDRLFVLEQDGKYIGAAFTKGSQLRPDFMADQLRMILEETLKQKLEEIENYKSQYRERMKTEIERHVTECRKHGEALLQESLNVPNSLIDYTYGSAKVLINILAENQREGETANSLVDSQAANKSIGITE